MLGAQGELDFFAFLVGARSSCSAWEPPWEPPSVQPTIKKIAASATTHSRRSIGLCLMGGRYHRSGDDTSSELRRIPLPGTWVNKLDSWVLTVRPSGRISMSDNSIATTPNSRVAPGGGGPTRTQSARGESLGRRSQPA